MLLVLFTVSLSGLTSSFVSVPPSQGDTFAGQVKVLASSPGNLFVGATEGGGYLYVGLLNGSVEKMDPQSGQISATVALPDRNSAAHLLYYNGSLYVGTEFLTGAKNKAPYHIYRIDPLTMQIGTQVAMNLRDANGFVQAYNGYLWAGDGACTLYKIKPGTLTVTKTVYGVAEDEMAYDGTNYWTQCGNSVNVLRPDSNLSTLATGWLKFPGRARGFFGVGSSIYSTDSANSTVYRMSLSGNTVLFTKVATFGGSALGTRDTLTRNGLLFAYGTRDDKPVQARIFVYDNYLVLEGAISLPGYGLPTDASQHSMFLLDGLIYFVTASAVGYFAPLNDTTP